MTSKAMWEIDPETRSKLLDIQKDSKNNVCCDCSSPSPQWASPKFGVFICLSCAGVHRGLGVHISFVRSISMDAFKLSELERMRLGGNAAWRAFFESHPTTAAAGLTWEDATIAERYGGAAGEEWKERLSCKVEGKEYEGGTHTATSTTTTPTTRTRSAQSPTEGSKIRVDDAYFERLGAANAQRRDDIPPSQGGKYGGFGNTSAPTSGTAAGAIPTMDDLQRDPVAALSKGFGWFTSTVAKTAKNVNDGYIQPTAKQIAESDIAKQAHLTAAQVARSAQQGARSAQDGLTRFVEGPESARSPGRGFSGMDEDKRAFWDDFSSIADERAEHKAPSAIGTSAMGRTNQGAAGAKGWDDW